MHRPFSHVPKWRQDQTSQVEVSSRRWMRPGFSAIEMLVVVAIFALGSLAIAATYVNFSSLHRRTANAEALGEEMRYVSELIVRSARNNTINYPSLPASLASPSSTLSLMNAASTSTIQFQTFATGSAVCAGLNAACLALNVNGSGWSAITGKNITINRFAIYITPASSPFQSTGIGTYNNNNQPRVTFQIAASYNARSPKESPSLSVQASVSSRIYLR